MAPRGLGQALEQAQVPVAAVELPEAPGREAAHSRLVPSFWERYVVFLRAPPAQPEQERPAPHPEVPVARPKPFFREQLWFRLKTTWNTPPTGSKGKGQSRFYLSTVETSGCKPPPE